jgi:hypothetical protein
MTVGLIITIKIVMTSTSKYKARIRGQMALIQQKLRKTRCISAADVVDAVITMTCIRGIMKLIGERRELNDRIRLLSLSVPHLYTNISMPSTRK